MTEDRPPVRSNTEKTLPPLSDEEFSHFEVLNGVSNGHTTSIDNILLSEKSKAEISKWMMESEFHHDENQNGLGYGSGEVIRIDSLEENPFMIDPREVSSMTSVPRIATLSNQKVFSKTSQNQVAPNIPLPTSVYPSTENWPGCLDFDVKFLRLAKGKTKSWIFSQKLDKLFIDMNKYVQACFEMSKNPPEDLFVRILPIFADDGSLQEPVRRCPNHAETSDMTNQGFPNEHRWHLVRVNHDNAKYLEDPSSKRLSVVMPLQRPQGGTGYSECGIKFMCLGSDVGGINRKPVKLIFTLEKTLGNVIGRRTMELRICSCPKRDKQQEEQKFNDEEQKPWLSAKSRSFQKTKRRKPQENMEDFVMIPVAVADYEKLNEFAEAAIIVRGKDNPEAIKSKRQKLLEKHNPGMFPRIADPSNLRSDSF